MAGAGSSKNGKDSASQRLGIKLFSGEVVRAGGIILRQRGLKFKPGFGVGVGSDDTLYALRDGVISFKNKKTVNVCLKSQ